SWRGGWATTDEETDRHSAVIEEVMEAALNQTAPTKSVDDLNQDIQP
ncbi:hypothetical protein LCGC14_3091340, partial [marine sediment metagenome]